MFNPKLVLCFAMLMASTNAKYAEYGGNGGIGIGSLMLTNEGYGDGGGSTYSLGSGTSMGLNLPEFQQSGPSYQSAGGASVSAAVQTRRTVEVKPVHIHQEQAEPHVVDVEASIQPVHVIFRSSSNPVMVQQIHTPSKPVQVEQTESEDEPHRVQHQVVRPVIQELREIIQPYRRILQEVRPVMEEVRTVVAKNSASNGQGSSYGSNGSGSGSGSNNGNGGTLYTSSNGGSGGYASAASSSAVYSDSMPAAVLASTPVVKQSRSAALRSSTQPQQRKTYKSRRSTKRSSAYSSVIA